MRTPRIAANADCLPYAAFTAAAVSKFHTRFVGLLSAKLERQLIGHVMMAWRRWHCTRPRVLPRLLAAGSVPGHRPAPPWGAGGRCGHPGGETAGAACGRGAAAAAAGGCADDPAFDTENPPAAVRAFRHPPCRLTTWCCECCAFRQHLQILSVPVGPEAAAVTLQNSDFGSAGPQRAMMPYCQTWHHPPAASSSLMWRSRWTLPSAPQIWRWVVMSFYWLHVATWLSRCLR